MPTLSKLILPAALLMTAGHLYARSDPAELTKALPPQFEKAVPLLTGKSRLMSKAYTYPAPALFDLDDDGIDELIVGDIKGRIFSFKQTEKNSINQWGKQAFLETDKAKNLKFNNW